MDKFIELAKKAIETYIKEGKIIKPPSPLPPEFQKKAGVFVSLHKIRPTIQFTPSSAKERQGKNLPPPEIYDGYQPAVAQEELRGCIGTYLPVRKNIAEEIIRNAIDSATSDPRFPPVSSIELPSLKCSVDILSIPTPVIKNEDLDPKRYGLIISTPDGRRGLLLPDIEEVETVAEQIEICRSKAGIGSSEKVTLQRFSVERHGEK